ASSFCDGRCRHGALGGAQPQLHSNCGIECPESNWYPGRTLSEGGAYGADVDQSEGTESREGQQVIESIDVAAKPLIGQCCVVALGTTIDHLVGHQPLYRMPQERFGLKRRRAHRSRNGPARAYGSVVQERRMQRDTASAG